MPRGRGWNGPSFSPPLHALPLVSCPNPRTPSAIFARNFSIAPSSIAHGGSLGLPSPRGLSAGDEDQMHYAAPWTHRCGKVVAQPDVRKPPEAVARLRQLPQP